MKPKIIINGAQGKMGKIASETIKASKSFELVAELGRGDDLATNIQKTQADIVIDLTAAESAYENTVTIIQNKARPVIGTSGLTEEQVASLQKTCAEQSLGGIIAPNFSIGAVLMMQFAKQAAPYFDYAEIIELHHEKKKDAPSGTSRKTAELIGDVRKNKKHDSEETLPGALGANLKSIPIHSVRMPGLLAHQEVIFGSVGETLNIRHDSIDRKGFMPGLLKSCEAAMTASELIYGLEHIL
jgi:4-hydroxy-tetrahydrodipicolinate reductase